MSRFVFSPVLPPSLAVAGREERFPLRRVFCVGRNYADHAREMGGDPGREPPFFFTKPADAVSPGEPGRPLVLPYPPATRDLHPEVELVVALKAGGQDLAPTAAADLVFGHAVGLDMTRRDLQAQAKAKGQPWDMAKGFDASAPIGPLLPSPGHPLGGGPIRLTVDGEVRQQGDIADLIWPVAELIANLSTLVRLAPGDLIFTGTPAGVAAVERGQTLIAQAADLPTLTVRLD
ncbi:fumarylacetoacetate hydrolase family protein [Roseospirillum parvum]|uniref:Fumarylpyruvate hydrolase n=1 Tax=Roseospirillum parvum TaxID=83401 RepID=A0A1G8EKD6_9PROT|nr:fumarylacetoacetate hydrolase family protein [Roseospirillum parvum]SDH70242.1 fumarylpyruvate hydrolase [Roseospirillum parvum]